MTRYRDFAIVGLLAVIVTLGVGCETTSVQEGAVLGGMLGAGTGAIIGNQSGHSGNGALIGAGAGALAGALVGDQVDRAAARPAAPAPVVVQPAPVVHQRPVQFVQPVQPPRPSPAGHYETRVVRTGSGETYEERVWVSGR